MALASEVHGIQELSVTVMDNQTCVVIHCEGDENATCVCFPQPLLVSTMLNREGSLREQINYSLQVL